MAAHRRKVLEHFSGTLCVDELHLGRFTLLLATDPLADLPVAFALVAANDQDHMRRFLRNLKTWGLNPEVVVTDGSNLYPARAGRVVARRGPPVVRLPRHQGHQQADPRRRAAAADGDEPAGQGRAEEEAGPQGGQVQGRRRPPRPDGQGEGALRVQAPPPDREAAGEPHRGGARRPDADAGVPARVGDAAAVRRPDLLAVRHAQGLPPGELPPGRDRARPGVPGGARVGQGDGATRRGEVPQADGVPEQPGEPAGADQQPRGADQPDVPVPGEGAVQVAATADAGAVRGVDAGRDLEGMDSARGEGRRSREAGQERHDASPMTDNDHARSREIVVEISEESQI